MTNKVFSDSSVLLKFIIVALLITGLTVSLVLISKPQFIKPKAASASATLTLSSDKNPLATNDTFTVTIALNPANLPLVGTDLNVEFDKNVFTLTDVQPNTASGFKTFVPLVTNTTTFDKSTVISSGNSSGVVKFGAAAFDFNAAGGPAVDFPVSTNVANLSRLVFQVKPSVTTTTTSTIKFTYLTPTNNDPSVPQNRKTTDTNVVIANSGSTTTPPEDVLAAPNPLSLNINVGPTAGQVSNLVATCNNSGTQATLTWTPGTNNDRWGIRVDDQNNNLKTASIANGTANNCGAGVTHDICINGWQPNSMLINIAPNTTYKWWVHGANATTYATEVFGTDIRCVPTNNTPVPTNTSAPSPTNTTTPGPKPGDADGDNDVDIVDFGVWLDHFQQTVAGGPEVGNFNKINDPNDTKVDLIDFALWLDNFKK